MLEDTLEAIAAARSIERTIVVSGDPRAQEIVAASGAEVLPDPSDEGHVPAALAGIARAEAGGAECVVLLPGDCPLLDPQASWTACSPACLRTSSPSSPTVTAPAPTPSPSPRPGRSVRPSARAAAPATSPPPARPAFPIAVEELASLGLDLDTPADVVALTRVLDEAGSGRAKRTAKALGI